MKRLIVIAAALLTLAGVSIVSATASGASVCQSNGTGCTKAGTYPGPNAVISNDYTGFKVVWTKSVVQPYSSGVPLYWTAYMTYTNVSSSALTLGCPGSWANASYVSEHMSGGSGDDGMVSAENTTCSQNHSLAVSVAPGSTYTLQATFHNVPWPGSAVSITWGGAGTSPNVNPFPSSTSPAPSTSCYNWEFLGLHGINEGSGSSPELIKFQAAVRSHGTVAAGQLPHFDSVSYPTISVKWQDAKAVFQSGPMWQNVLEGVAALQAKVSGLKSTCPGSLISLFGYSEGAWVINVWEQLYPGEASINTIRNVGLIGDPCFWNVASSGLARLFTSSCSAGTDYWFDPPTGTYSECLNLDPVCGAGYFGNAAAMLAAAALCAPSSQALCAHFGYRQSGDGDIGDIAWSMLSENGGYLQVLSRIAREAGHLLAGLPRLPARNATVLHEQSIKMRVKGTKRRSPAVDPRTGRVEATELRLHPAGCRRRGGYSGEPLAYFPLDGRQAARWVRLRRLGHGRDGVRVPGGIGDRPVIALSRVG